MSEEERAEEERAVAPDRQTARAVEQAFVLPFWLQRSSAWAWRVLLLVAAGLTFGYLLLNLRVVVLPVLIATMLASVLTPLVEWLVGKRFPRLLATWVVLIAVGIVIGGSLVFAGWGLSTELAGDAERWEQVADETRDWLENGPIGLSAETIADVESRARRTVVGGASFGSDRARLVGETLGGLFLSLALTFFFVKDGAAMWRWILARLHPNRRTLADEAGQRAVEALGSYLRAMTITGVVDAVTIGLGLWVIGVPLVVPLVVLTFFAAFLPVVGATAAGGLAALVALIANGPGDAILVVLLTLVVQQVEGDVILPYVMGKQVSLHPAVVLAALAAGGAVAGIIGAFVAVPFAAVITAAVSAVGDRRTQSAEAHDDAIP